MFSIVLYEPEIPPNTGNIIRLCANIGADLHLVKPLGFELSDRALRRAGLDYHEYASVSCYENWAACTQHFSGRRFFACTTKGQNTPYDVSFEPGDVLVFGCETRGLPAEVLASFAPTCRLRLPMRSGQRSLNLANAVAVVAYEAWRQNSFLGT